MREAPATIEVEIDRSVPVPPYYQLSEAIREQIEDGRLQSGERLPAVRVLSRRCGVSSFTVKRALDTLGREGLLVSRSGSGTYVGPQRAPAIEVICPYRKGEFEAGSDYIQRIPATISRRYDQADRRCFLSMVDDKQTLAVDIVNVCRARRVNGIVAFRPIGAVQEALAVVAKKVATVSLYLRMEGARADAVVSDPIPPLRRMLAQRLERGQRRFAYLGKANVLQNNRPWNGPYWQVHEESIAMLRAAGVTPEVHIVPLDKHDDTLDEYASRIADGTTVIASTPNVYESVRRMGKSFDLLSYTEYANTRDAYLGRVALLYAGVEEFTEAGVDLLDRRIGDVAAAPRCVQIEAESLDTLDEGRAPME